MKLLLFDIDGTLVNSGGAGNRAFSRALEEVYGLSDGLNGVWLDGKTDIQIVREVFTRRQLSFEHAEEVCDELFRTYLGFLKVELELAGDRYEVLPGVDQLLTILSRDDRLFLGLATGNIEQGARLKLEVGRLNGFFADGGFGSDAECRTELIKIAIRRCEKKSALGTMEPVVVIGDTPRDIRHAHEAGAEVVAVASGRYSADQLEECGPELVVETLTPSASLLGFLRG